MSKENHGNLAKALAAFQLDLPSVHKGSTNPHYKNTFADLTDMSKVVIPALAAHGLAWSVVPRYEGGVFILTGVLLHESGEKIEGQYPMVVGKPQEIGSGMTYGRRHLLGAMTGVVGDEHDDDGNVAQSAKPAMKPAPAGWRKAITDATTEDSLKALYAGWQSAGTLTDEMTSALTARKKAIIDG